MSTRLAGIVLFVLSSAVAPAQLPQGTPTDPALDGEWTTVEGKHAGKVLTKEQLAKIKFGTGGGVVGIDLTPIVPADAPVKSLFGNVTPAAKQLRFGRNIGLKAVSYHGIYEVKDDTLKIGLDLLPWERTTGDPSYLTNRVKAFPTEKEPNSGPDTILVFKRVKK